MIFSNGKEVIRIPIQSLNEYKIRYNQETMLLSGQGSGDSQVGDLVASGNLVPHQSTTDINSGTQQMQDYYETDITIEELEEEFFRTLRLPNLAEKENESSSMRDITFNTMKRSGLVGNIDKKRTLLQAFQRNIMSGNDSFYPIQPEDVRYKVWNPIDKPESKAVILAMLDTSGSMNQFKRNIARSFFYWLKRFLTTNYVTVEIVFIAHDTEAEVMDEKSFFSKGGNGGTVCSTAYRKALNLIQEKYAPNRYNIYPFHVSDGDNLRTDNRRCKELVKELLYHSRLFGYIEINQQQRHATLMELYKEITATNIAYYGVKSKNDVYDAMQYFFSEKSSTSKYTSLAILR